MTFEEIDQPDPWCQETDGNKQWELSDGHPGSRVNRIGKCRVSGDRAVIKFDSVRLNPHDQAVREKICCDLAQHAKIPTPGALLARISSEGDGVAVRYVPDTISFAHWRQLPDIKSKPGYAMKYARQAYPLSVVAFDLWVGNTDRNQNNGNVLVAGDDPEQPKLIPIDFGETLGTSKRPWHDQPDQIATGYSAPYPNWLTLDESERGKVAEIFKEFSRIAEETVREVVERSLSYFGLKTKSEETTIFRGLLTRRAKEQAWILENLKQQNEA
jgi:hypothetical protein